MSRDLNGSTDTSCTCAPADSSEETTSGETCTFGGQRVGRGLTVDVGDRCTVCRCLFPPEVTCHRVHCPRIEQWWELPPGNHDAL